MKLQSFTYMADCNKMGIRVYPILEYGMYRLVIEFNESEEFNRGGVIKTQKGDAKYDPTKKDWNIKILELYEYLYNTKVAKKISVA